MEHIELSPQFKATSLPVPSPTASHIACLSGARLQIRNLSSFELIRNIPLPSSHDLRNSRLAWSPPSFTALPGNASPARRPSPLVSHRILVGDDDTTRVYDLRDERWSAVISNGSGGMGRNVHVQFGQTDREVLVWSDFGSRLVVWCLQTGRTVEIRDPKFSGVEGRGWGYRPPREVEEEEEEGARLRIQRGEVMALLCRCAGLDVLLLLAPRTYAVLKRVELPTVDAQGLRWSRDGRWIAVWDSAASGFRLCVYTADGHLYRTVTREAWDDMSEWNVEGLGIKSVEWVPGNEWLAVGGWDQRVRILSTKTFAPVVFLDHTTQVCVPSAPVYTEQVDAAGARSYALTQQPVTLPKAPAEKNDNGLMKQGIGLMAFNSGATMCATREDLTPTTVRLWDLRSLKPRAILIQHSPVKNLRWHPSHPSLLLIQTAQDAPIIHLYTAPTFSTSTNSLPSSSSTSHPPTILDLSAFIAKPAGSATPKWDAKFLPTTSNKKPALLLGHQHAHIVVWPEGKDQILRFETQDVDESDDSLYDILTRRMPVPPLHEDVGWRSDGSGSSEFVDVDEDKRMETVRDTGYEERTRGLEDTFRQRRMGVGKGRRLFEDSGLDEMF